MEIAAGVIELQEGTEKNVAAWQETMARRRAEALQALCDEGVEIESWFGLEIAGRSYLLWYMRADSMDKAWEVFNNSTREIDIFHSEAIGNMAVDAITADPLIDFDRNGADR